jgi:hypothetical protein
VVYSDVTGESRRNLTEFFGELAARASAVSPNLEALRGIDHFKWLMLIVGYCGVAGVFGLMLLRSPREPIMSAVVALILAIYLLTSFATTVTNWPRYLFAEQQTDGSRRHALYQYLADRYEEFISPLLALATFIVKPSEIADEIRGREKKGFARALGAIGLAFVFFTALSHVLIWYFSLSDILKFPTSLIVEGAMLAVPVGCFVVSFLLLRIAFGYDDLSPFQYLHAFLYAVALLLVTEIAAGTAITVLMHVAPKLPADWIAHISQRDAVLCSDPRSSDCSSLKEIISAEQAKHQVKYMAIVVFAALAISGLILLRLGSLLKLAFDISRLRSNIANLAAMIVALLMVWWAVFSH